MSKTQFPLPKGVEINNIEIDVKNNLLTIVYEEEKPVLKVGEWWYHSTGVLNLIVEINESMKTVKCIPTYGIPKSGGFSFHGISTMTHKADMKEVKKLLILEAEKRGFKDGVMCKPPFKNAYKRKVVGELRLHERGSVIDANENILFEPTTGNWAEIIPEKKPLYVNQYGTEFFEGDDNWFVQLSSGQIMQGDDDEAMEASKYATEALTIRECHRWIDEHWDELNK